MTREFDYRKVVVNDCPELCALKDAFLNATDKVDATEVYLDDMDEYVTKSVPALIENGKLEDAWNVVIQAYAQLTDIEIEDYDDNEMHESCRKWMNAVLSKVEGLEKKEEVLSLLIWMEKTDSFPCWVRSASAELVHDLFSEPELLERIAVWYKDKYDEDPVENGAFWKGKLRDIAERLDSPSWNDIYESMTEADPIYTDLVYAECIARRRDARCLEVWDKIEKELGDLETEEDAAIYYSILWGRLDWYDLNGTDEEAEAAANVLNAFVALLHDQEGECSCGCGHDHEHEEHECGCGHHHEHEEHECGCGHHHHHDEDHECKCGGHHHDEEHECCCGKHH